ncbi:fam-c protein [Plasmodium chabaudi chabaudi]|uniref:Fam-c protein n=1 Tax=Plasmodium chabaudi chabaudi TaxID=31271 RepID=A0A077TMA3_PLACU|nr:fam-c protein [Plasmodium chabaudi chabaudi]SCL85737.1 fam-c protein [Plasmodium chabaudi chabaudi]VTZ69455.1 fam-c protein [Plasmodium chabaudi chabaudi]|eukprot:XP_016654122.1 fam-c protein [Plasmodium chabaudi chabaudi]
MNKKIYRLAIVVSYILLIVTIQCFTNNDDLNKYFKKNKNIHDEYETNSIDINNSGNFRYRSLSEHSIKDNYALVPTRFQAPSNNKKSKGYNCFNIFKRDKKANKSSNNNEPFLKEVVRVGNNLHNFHAKNPENLKLLSQLIESIEKQPSNNNESFLKEILLMKNNRHEFFENDSESVDILSQLKEGLSNHPSNSDESLLNELLMVGNNMHDFLGNDPEAVELLSKLIEKSEKQLSNNNKSLLKEALVAKNNKDCLFKNDPEALEILSQLKERLRNHPSKFKQSE